jgi:hypothetical protein
VSDLVAFLTARLDEDERVARAVPIEEWGSHDGCRVHPAQEQDGFLAIGRIEAQFEEEAEHIARHDPARVLREVDAKRTCIAFLGHPDAPPGEGRYVAERVLWLLALAYSDHPDYREEWRPEP